VLVCAASGDGLRPKEDSLSRERDRNLGRPESIAWHARECCRRNPPPGGSRVRRELDPLVVVEPEGVPGWWLLSFCAGNRIRSFALLASVVRVAKRLPETDRPQRVKVVRQQGEPGPLEHRHAASLSVPSPLDRSTASEAEWARSTQHRRPDALDPVTGRVGSRELEQRRRRHGPPSALNDALRV
jgi:hypothetical protein